ncbi:MAG: hypothetical protein K2N34_00130, partial [Lachnospiraceae bacterium]|nr:hypothetical protein [Lachnospiraceae bacterium]
MKRMFTFQYFIKSVLFMLILLGLSVITYFKQYGAENCTLYAIVEDITMGGFFFELIYIPASLFAVLNLGMDIRQNGYYLYSVRSSKAAYIIAKIAVGVLFAILITETAMNIMLGTGASFLDIIDREFYTGGADIYEDVLKNSTFLYFEMRIFFISLSAGLFTAMGMFVTAIIPDRYVAVSSSYMASIIFQKLELILQLPDRVDVSGIIGGFVRVSTSVIHSVAYIVLLFCSGIVFLTYVFNKIMRRRCYDEKE